MSLEAPVTTTTGASTLCLDSILHILWKIKLENESDMIRCLGFDEKGYAHGFLITAAAVVLAFTIFSTIYNGELKPISKARNNPASECRHECCRKLSDLPQVQSAATVGYSSAAFDLYPMAVASSTVKSSNVESSLAPPFSPVSVAA